MAPGLLAAPSPGLGRRLDGAVAQADGKDGMVDMLDSGKMRLASARRQRR